MVTNNEGYLKPYIDFQKCSSCGKCDEICPVLFPEYSNSEEPETYVLQGPDGERIKGTSGGAFYLMAKKIIEMDGAVYGAVWNEDFSVSIIRGTDLETVGRMRGSKYVQSNVGRSYADVESDLKKGLNVLYSACPCQIAGLKKYLSREYDKLITVDILCTCVPSQKMFLKYISENENKPISSIIFRDKIIGDGGSHTHTVYYTDATSDLKEPMNDSYELALSKKMLASDACASCMFSRLPRQGDISIGDFWGIERIDSRYRNKDNGCSIVITSSKKGSLFFKSLDFKGSKFEEIESNVALNSPNVIKNRGNLANRGVRHAFFKLMNKMSIEESVNTALKSNVELCVKKYDVGLVGFWSANNYGSVLTNYALYKVVENFGYSVAMVEFPEEFRDMNVDCVSRQFAGRNFETTFVPIKKQLTKYNKYFDKFLVGSDQVWNPDYIKRYGMYMYLDFVQDSKTRVAYAASIGRTDLNISEESKELLKYYLNKFDAISLREVDGVELYGKLGIPAEHVLDPVWLCPIEEYDFLVAQSELNLDEKFIFSYVLDPSIEKINIIEHFENKFGMECINVGDLRRLSDPLYERLNTDFFASNEDWLYYIKNAEYIITDSHHGAVFAMIYNKPFICIANPKRTLSRFTSLFRLLQVEDRLLESSVNVADLEPLYSAPDYDRINAIVASECKKSIKWLSDALAIEGKGVLSDFDVLLDKLRKIGDEVWTINTEKSKEQNK